MPWGAVIGAVVGGVAANRAAKKGAKAQTDAANASNEVQLQMFNQSRQDMEPWRQAGMAGLSQYMQFMGMPAQSGPSAQVTGGPSNGQSPWTGVINAMNGGGGSASGWFQGAGPNQQRYASDPIYREAYDEVANHHQRGAGGAFDQRSDFGKLQAHMQSAYDWRAKAKAGGNQGPAVTGAPSGSQPKSISDLLKATPGYQFRFDEGQKAVESSAAAQGGLNSGKTLKALTQYGQNYATGIYGDHMNRLAGLAGIGQTATTQMGQWGQNYANQASNNMMNAGNARSSMYAQQGQNYADLASGIGNMYTYNRMRNGG